jgi:hypothetical protein
MHNNNKINSKKKNTKNQKQISVFLNTTKE